MSFIELWQFLKELEPLTVAFALIGTLITAVLFIFPELGKRIQSFLQHIVAHPILRVFFVIAAIIGVGVFIGYKVWHIPEPDPTLHRVKKRGELHCGVSGEVGFSFLDPDSGEYEGLDVELCKALAVAVLGDASQVTYIPLLNQERFEALTNGYTTEEGKLLEVDVLFRNTSFSAGRDLGLEIDFGPPYYIDKQAILIRGDADIKEYNDLNGKKLCVSKGTTSYHNIISFIDKRNIDLEIITGSGANNRNDFRTNQAVFDAFFSSSKQTCVAMTTDRSQIVAQLQRDEASFGEVGKDGCKMDYCFLADQFISREILSPVVRSDDHQWLNIVTYVVYGLMIAEELDITQKKIVEGRYNSSSTISTRELLGIDAANDAREELKVKNHIGERLGLNQDFMQQVVKQVGNYGEIYQKFFDEQRGPNQIWSPQYPEGAFTPPPFNSSTR